MECRLCLAVLGRGALVTALPLQVGMVPSRWAAMRTKDLGAGGAIRGCPHRPLDARLARRSRLRLRLRQWSAQSRGDVLALALVLGVSGALLTAGSAVAADFTWAGAEPLGTPDWSHGGNWEGGVAPFGSVGTLTFPGLLGEPCPELVHTCYQSSDDIPGLDVNRMSFGGDTSAQYAIGGEALTLGAGGLTAAMTSGDGVGYATLTLPITLGAPQVWSIDGNNNGSGIDIADGGRVEGPAESLAVHLSSLAALRIEEGDMEAGPITITGANSGFSGVEASLNGEVALGSYEAHSERVVGHKSAVHAADASPSSFLNATDKNAVDITDVSLTSFTGDIGPLTSTGGLLDIEETLTVAGGVTLDPTSELELHLGSQLTATGNVNLGNAKLSLPGSACGSPVPGEVYTLVSTSGSVSSTFGGIPNGGTIEQKDGYCTNEYAALRINYTAHAVTATVVRSSYSRPPDGGALTLLELLSGADNPSEFCPLCFLRRLISFVSPVDAPTGNFWHTFDDLSVPGRGIPLDLTRTYNSMSAATDGPLGFGWSFPYDMSLSFPDATHVVVNQENGSQVTFTEQSGGTYTAPPRVTAALVHNEDGSWTFVRRHSDTFSFDSSGRLTQEQDLNGYVTALAYNGSGQLATVTDPAGRKLTFAYTGDHISSVTDPLGRVVRYAYDGEGNLTDVTDVNGGDTHFTYDTQHRMLTMRFPDQAPGVPGSTGAVVSNRYDAQGRVIEQTDQLGRTTKFAYTGETLGEAGGTTTITDPKGAVTVQNYQYGELLSETKGYGTPQAATWTFGYDPATLGMTSVTDPDGHTTTSTFDSEGNTLTTTDALGRTTTNTYDSLNDLLTSTDPLGVTTTMTYDAHGHLLSTSRPLTGTSEAQTTTYTYGDSSHPGDVTAMTDPEGNTWKYTYDADGNRSLDHRSPGGQATSTYNAIGWLMSTTSPRGNAGGANPAGFTTTYAHNNFGQMTETVDPLGHKTTSQYDPDQNLIASTDADGNTTTYTYDAADEQTAVHRADGTTLQTTYWPDGTVEEQIDGAGHATLYEYDPLGRVSAVTDPLGRTTRYGYDPAGNGVTRHRPRRARHDDHLRRCRRADLDHVQRRQDPERHRHHLRRRRPADRDDRRQRHVVVDVGFAAPPHERHRGRQRHGQISVRPARRPDDDHLPRRALRDTRLRRRRALDRRDRLAGQHHDLRLRLRRQPDHGDAAERHRHHGHLDVRRRRHAQLDQRHRGGDTSVCGQLLAGRRRATHRRQLAARIRSGYGYTALNQLCYARHRHGVLRLAPAGRRPVPVRQRGQPHGDGGHDTDL